MVVVVVGCRPAPRLVAGFPAVTVFQGSLAPPEPPVLQTNAMGFADCLRSCEAPIRQSSNNSISSRSFGKGQQG